MVNLVVKALCSIMNHSGFFLINMKVHGCNNARQEKRLSLLPVISWSFNVDLIEYRLTPSENMSVMNSNWLAMKSSSHALWKRVSLKKHERILFVW